VANHQLRDQRLPQPSRVASMRHGGGPQAKLEMPSRFYPSRIGLLTVRSHSPTAFDLHVGLEEAALARSGLFGERRRMPF